MSAAFDQSTAATEHTAAVHARDAAVGPIRLVSDLNYVATAIPRGDALASVRSQTHAPKEVCGEQSGPRVYAATLLLSPRSRFAATSRMYKGFNCCLAAATTSPILWHDEASCSAPSVVPAGAALLALWADVTEVVRIVAAALAVRPPSSLEFGSLCKSTRGRQSLGARRS